MAIPLQRRHIKVYEMETYLDPDAEYTQDIDLKSMASDIPLAEFDYTPKVELDSVTQDTNFQSLIIPLDIALGEKLINADSLDMINNDVFLQYFKGLLLESADVSGEGSLVTLYTAPIGTFRGAALLVYYNNDENTILLEADEDPDTLLQPYEITQYSARVSEFKTRLLRCTVFSRPRSGRSGRRPDLCAAHRRIKIANYSYRS